MRNRIEIGIVTDVCWPEERGFLLDVQACIDNDQETQFDRSVGALMKPFRPDYEADQASALAMVSDLADCMRVDGFESEGVAAGVDLIDALALHVGSMVKRAAIYPPKTADAPETQINESDRLAMHLLVALTKSVLAAYDRRPR